LAQNTLRHDAAIRLGSYPADRMEAVKQAAHPRRTKLFNPCLFDMFQCVEPAINRRRLFDLLRRVLSDNSWCRKTHRDRLRTRQLLPSMRTCAITRVFSPEKLVFSD